MGGAARRRSGAFVMDVPEIPRASFRYCGSCCPLVHAGCYGLRPPVALSGRGETENVFLRNNYVVAKRKRTCRGLVERSSQ